MLEELLRYLETSEGPLAYVVLAVSAALEYVVPPFPGDTVTLFGCFLATSAGYHLVLVHGVMTIGSVAGGALAFAFGQYIGHREDRWPAFLRGERTRRAIARVRARFERHGGAYLAINRFVPALRGVFFVAAGIAEVPLWKVIVFGGVSAAAWNGLILALGYSFGRNWERLRAFADEYTFWALVVLGVVILAGLLRWIWRRRAR
jgi:membrane protein DedA with SNARE-associated domain